MDELVIVSVDGHAQMPQHLWPEYLEVEHHHVGAFRRYRLTELAVVGGEDRLEPAIARNLRDEFGEVRSLVTPESMNEVLVAGAGVGRVSTLDAYGRNFPDWRDRMYWKRIKLRRV